jgi:hypothetical protein
MNGETRTADAVELPLAKEVEQLRETMELHDLYKKHDTHQTLDADGNPVDEDAYEAATYITYRVSLCHGCRMPVEEDGKKLEVNDNSMNEFLASEKKYKHATTYIVCMQDRLQHFSKRPTTREHTGHLEVDRMLKEYAGYLKHDQVREQILQCMGDEKLNLSQAATQLVRYEEAFMGAAQPETYKQLFDLINGPEEHRWEHKRDEAASLYIALALRHKIKLDRTQVGLVMKRSKNLRLKHELTAQTGKFRLSAVRAIRLNEALASYHYIRKWKPELLQDSKWVGKKLRFDKNENDLVKLRYYIDTGLGWEHLESAGISDEMLTAVARFIPTLHPGSDKAIKAWVEGQTKSDQDGYRFVFGTPTDRRELYTVDDAYQLMHQCTNIEMWLKYMMDSDIRKQTADPVADLLDLPGPDND